MRAILKIDSRLTPDTSIKLLLSLFLFAACNILSVSTTDPFTLRNYGRRINCTLMAVYPATVQVIALGVGGSSSQSVVHTTETGTLRKVRCKATPSATIRDCYESRFASLYILSPSRNSGKSCHLTLDEPSNVRF